jgi:hypothetical protein
MSNGHAVVVLPPGAYGQLTDRVQRQWLSRGRVSFQQPQTELLPEVLHAIGAPVPESGLAALRFWGQTGERSDAWMAAADPVHFETKLRHLVVRALLPGDLTMADLRELFKLLQDELGADDRFAFASLGDYGYLRCQQPMETAGVSASVASGRVPDDCTPAGDSARSYHQLQGELQMLLHEHDVNQRRTAAGLLSVSTLWFWGGGVAPEKTIRPMPALFGNDPLFAGYWESFTGIAEPWKGEFDPCLALSPDEFVVVIPETGPGEGNEVLADCMGRLRRHLKRGDLNRLTLLFRDGLRVEMQRSDIMKFWSGVSSFLTETENDE